MQLNYDILDHTQQHNAMFSSLNHVNNLHHYDTDSQTAAPLRSHRLRRRSSSPPADLDGGGAGAAACRVARTAYQFTEPWASAYPQVSIPADRVARRGHAGCRLALLAGHWTRCAPLDAVPSRGHACFDTTSAKPARPAPLLAMRMSFHASPASRSPQRLDVGIGGSSWRGARRANGRRARSRSGQASVTFNIGLSASGTIQWRHLRHQSTQDDIACGA